MNGDDPTTPAPESPFAHGPYTTGTPVFPPMPDHAPDTDAETPQQVIDRRALRKVMIFFVAPVLFILGYLVAGGNLADGDPHPSVPRTTGQGTTNVTTMALPACEEEDGSTQQVCMWDDGSGHKIINMNYGHFTYDATTNLLMSE